MEPPAVDPPREEAELRAYLGPRFDRSRLERWREQVPDELARVGDEQLLYRTSEAYLYDLTVFAMSGTKLPYLAELVRHLSPGARVLDYGCGIGSDGLALLEAGYRVELADFDNPSTRYLRWRLERRGLSAPVHDLDGEVPGGFDAAYAFDVIEHVDDPIALLEELESRATLVCVNLLAESEEEASPLHRTLPIAAILRRAADRGLLSHSVHHGRSHLLLYRPGDRQRGAGGRLRAMRARRRAARLERSGDG